MSVTRPDQLVVTSKVVFSKYNSINIFHVAEFIYLLIYFEYAREVWITTAFCREAL